MPVIEAWLPCVSKQTEVKSPWSDWKCQKKCIFSPCIHYEQRQQNLNASPAERWRWIAGLTFCLNNLQLLIIVSMCLKYYSGFWTTKWNWGSCNFSVRFIYFQEVSSVMQILFLSFDLAGFRLTFSFDLFFVTAFHHRLQNTRNGLGISVILAELEYHRQKGHENIPRMWS